MLELSELVIPMLAVAGLVCLVLITTSVFVVRIFSSLKRIEKDIAAQTAALNIMTSDVSNILDAKPVKR